jgi:predicted dehydrogenase
MGLKAFAAGKHVLTEKPVAANADEVRRLIAAARAAKRVGACCSSRYRFLTSSGVTADFLASGALGALRVVRARGVNPAGAAPTQAPPDWRLKRDQNGGGILMNWGCYDLDFVLGLTGWRLRPRLVLAQCWTLAPHLAARAAPGSDAETHGLAVIQCDDGILLSFERAEFASSAADNTHQFIGETGTLRTVMAAPRKSVFHDHTDGQFGLLTRTLWEGDDPTEVIHAGPLRDFASAILHGRAPKTTLEQALMVQQITDAVYASSAGRCAVPIA